MLLELQLDEPGGEPGAVDRDIDLLENIWDGADVVLMAVGDEQAPQPGFVLDEIGHVGDDAIDAVHIIAGEGHAAVHHDDLAAVLIGGHVLADLVETAKRDDFQFFCHSNSFSIKRDVSHGGQLLRQKMSAAKTRARGIRTALIRRRLPPTRPTVVWMGKIPLCDRRAHRAAKRTKKCAKILHFAQSITQFFRFVYPQLSDPL